MDEKIRAEFFSRRFSLMQGTILGQIDEELDDDVFAKLITAYFHTVSFPPFLPFSNLFYHLIPKTSKI